jgi:hypothetical protein
MKLSIKPLLPRTARVDVGGLCADGPDPILYRLGDELRAFSERMCEGTPRRINKSEIPSMTSMDLSRRDTRMARHL